jgi:anti-sigma factor RsiW
MNCHSLKPEIIPYHQNELSPADRAGFERHVQLCPACARLSHEMSLAMELSQATLERKHEGNIAPRVEAILGRVPALTLRFRWVLVPALTALLVGAMITPEKITNLPDTHPEALTVAQDLEMFSDYDLLENLDMLEASSGPDNEAAVL